MSISINVTGLKEHLTYLKLESEEVDRLLQILNIWQCQDVLHDPHYFLNLRNSLKKQKDMIDRRQQVMEALINEFTQCIYSIERELQEADDALKSLYF